MVSTKASRAKKVTPAKTTIDFFWYFLVLVIGFIYIVERNIIEWDENAWQMIKEAVPFFITVCGFGAYRAHSKIKTVAEEQEEVIDDKQDELDETKDELAESKQHNRGQ